MKKKITTKEKMLEKLRIRSTLEEGGGDSFKRGGNGSSKFSTLMDGVRG